MKTSRLLTEIHERGQGLARIGAIDKHTLRDLDTLCLSGARALSETDSGDSKPKPYESGGVRGSLEHECVSTCRSRRSAKSGRTGHR